VGKHGRGGQATDGYITQSRKIQSECGMPKAKIQKKIHDI
jgi:hypothetical protein